jgi:GNAT superfamily N-acetyltransferase
VKERDVRIRDGTSIRVRPIAPSDKRALADGFARLSDESRYRRFFAPLNRLSTTDLSYLTEVDHHDHEALIAFDPGSDQTIGVARFVRSDDPAVAEVAVTVADDWQGRGVATALLEQLVGRAREEGIERFLALILEDNEAAVQLFQHLSRGDPEPKRSASGYLELLIELPEGDTVSGTLLGRALSFVARERLVVNPWRLLKHRVHETAEHAIPDAAPQGEAGRDESPDEEDGRTDAAPDEEDG